MGDQPNPRSLPSLNRRNVIRSLLFKIPASQQGPTFAPALHFSTPSSDCSSSNSTDYSDKSCKVRSSSHTASSSSPPHVSAQSWAVLDIKSGKLVGGFREQQPREIASLTKIMTCYLVLNVAENYNISLESLVKVSRNAAETCGTSARLKEGEEIQIWDLLHGLMLPSGNDAAVCLAEHFGKILAKISGIEGKCKEPIKYFVREMNQTAKELGLNNTFFNNPHGMSMPKNKSTATDVCKLAATALENELFQMICCAEYHTCYVVQPSGYSYRTTWWQNTNKLLSEGFVGVKTGVTPMAGPCLCASLKRKGKQVVVVILNSKSMDHRWTDLPRLAHWGLNNL